MVAAAAPMLNIGAFRLFAQSNEKYSARAVDLVRKSTVIDMLNPLSLLAAMSNIDGVHRVSFFEDPTTFTAADLERTRSSGFTVMHIAVGTGGLDAYDETLRFLALWDGFIAHHGDAFMRIDTPERLDTVKSSGKIGILLGVQNSEHFRKLDDVNFFYSLGQRVSQLTYNAQNLLGCGCTERHDCGITDFGVAIIEKMNEVGMLVDVSHCGDLTTLEAFEVSKKPVAITHSNCRALFNHPRLKTDEAIRKMAAKGGVMGITGVRMFVRGEEPTTLEHIVDHIEHVAKLVGVEHVGIGTDSDLLGYDALPADQAKKLRSYYKASYGFRERIDIEGFDHPRKLFDLTEALLRRGFGDADIGGVLGGNFRRLLGQVWEH